MKIVLNLMKKGAKWYFEQSSKNCYWTPTGIIPIQE